MVDSISKQTKHKNLQEVYFPKYKSIFIFFKAFLIQFNSIAIHFIYILNAINKAALGFFSDFFKVKIKKQLFFYFY